MEAKPGLEHECFHLFRTGDGQHAGRRVFIHRHSFGDTQGAFTRRGQSRVDAVDLFAPLFAVSRIAGPTAHMLEQQQHNRLIRLRAKYVGSSDLSWSATPGRQPMVEADPEAQCVAGRPANCPAALRVPPLFR